MKYRVVASGGLRARFNPRVDAPILGVAPEGALIDVASISGEWASVLLVAGGVTLIPSAKAADSGTCYLRVRDGADVYLAPALVPVPQPRVQRIGLHILNPMSEHSGQVAERAVGMGCRVVTIIDDEVYAQKLADRGVRVFFRWWIGDMQISPAMLAGRVAAFCRHPNIVVLGLNEGDVTGCFTAEQMTRRGQWDTEAFKRIRDQGGTYAGFGAAVGNPDFTNQAVCDVVNRFYAPLWAQGMLVNYHAYSPARNRWFAEGDRDWYEGRWRKLFTSCGLDPSNPARSEIISDEAGMDQDGGGGFKWGDVSAEQLREWCALHYAHQGAPLVVDGQTFPSPYTDATLYQASESVKWAGYNVSDLLAGVQWSKA